MTTYGTHLALNFGVSGPLLHVGGGVQVQAVGGGEDPQKGPEGEIPGRED